MLYNPNMPAGDSAESFDWRTVGDWEEIKKEREKEKGSPVLTKNPPPRTAGNSPNLLKMWSGNRHWRKVRRCQGELRNTNEIRKVVRPGWLLWNAASRSFSQNPHASFSPVSIRLTLISKAHSACQDSFHSSPGLPAIQRFRSRKRKHTRAQSQSGTPLTSFSWNPL